MKNKKNPRIPVLFQMDSLENLDVNSDSTLNLIQEALKINIEVWIGQPKNLTYFGGKASITAKKIISKDLNFSKPKNIKIDEFSYYFIRQDPPFDMSYLTNCYCKYSCSSHLHIKSIISEYAGCFLFVITLKFNCSPFHCSTCSTFIFE